MTHVASPALMSLGGDAVRHAYGARREALILRLDQRDLLGVRTAGGVLPRVGSLCRESEEVEA